MRIGTLKIYDGTKIKERYEVTMITEPSFSRDRNGNVVWSAMRIKKHQARYEYPETNKWVFDGGDTRYTFVNPVIERDHPMILFFNYSDLKKKEL